MGPVDRCRWLNVADLLQDTSEVRSYEAMGCDTAEREAFDRRFWTYSDPSWLVPGNDRRTEHLARAVEVALQEAIHRTGCDSTSFNCMWWRGDLVNPSSDLIRYGSRDSWRRFSSENRQSRRVGRNRFEHVSCGGQSDLPIMMHGFDRFSVAARYHFVPSGLLEVSRDLTWDVNAGPEVGVAGLPPGELCNPHPVVPERFAPSYASLIEGMTAGQTGAFRRSDGRLAIAVASRSRIAPELAVHSRDHERLWKLGAFAFVVHESPMATLAQAGRTAATLDASGRIAAILDLPGIGTRDAVVGLEALLPTSDAASLGAIAVASPAFAGTTLIGASGDGGVLLRFRALVPALPANTQRVEISDALLLSPPESGSVNSLEVAAGMMMPETRVTNSRVALYWELYGLQQSETVTYTLRLIPRRVERGRWETVWRTLRFAPADAPVLMQWQDVSRAPTRPGRSTTLGLGNIPAGEYVLELTASAPTQAPVTAIRALTVVR